MRLLVVSDLHIRDAEDPLYESLLRILRERAQSGDFLVLAGDLFDLFLGDKPVFMKRYSAFFEELKNAGSRGVRIHYIEGNHDFQMQKAFEGIPGFEIHSHEVTLTLNGKKFFVAHGDTVDRSDYGYRALRVLFRSPLTKALIKALPDSWVEGIGKKSSETSRAGKPRVTTELPLERMEYLRKVYRSYAAERLAEGFDYVVLGHCHDLDEMKYQIGGRSGHYMNVGYPRAHGSFLIWSQEEPELARTPLP